jgi:osmotically-inducible protein OsmY
MADRYDEERWLSRKAEGWDDTRIQDRDRNRGERAYNRDRSERGAISRGADEVRSWFGDDEAQRRREMDEQRDRYSDVRNWSREGRGGSQYPNAPGSERGWTGRPDAWESGSRANRADAAYPGYYDRSAEFRDDTYRSHFSNPEYDRLRSGASDRQRSGYFDSSMGYASAPAGGSLNPFPYRGPGSFAGRGPRNYQRSDERIREDVIDRLTDDPRVDASDIDVRVQNGEVTLSGKVQDRRMRRAAEECIEDLMGVRDVHNELGIEGNRGGIGEPGAPQERNDVTSLNLSGAQTQETRETKRK